MANNRGLGVWNVTTGKGRLPGGALIGTLPEPTGDRVDGAAFGPNDEQIVTGEDGGLKVWNAATRRAIFGVRMTSADMGSAAFSPDGRLVAYGWDDGKLRLLDARTGKTRRVLSPGSWVTHISFSPDGALVATSGTEVPVKVWRVSTGQSVAVLPSSTVDAASIAFDGSGQLIVSANKDGTASVWDVATETAIATTKGPRHVNLLAAQVASDGRILTTSADKRVRVYTCDACGSLSDLLALAPTRITRNLTPQEQQRYLNR
jgi:WD40 repeat protein